MTRVRDVATIVERLADLPTALPALRLLAVFGSVATGRATDRSDVDLAVECDAGVDRLAVHRLVAERLGTDAVDVVDLRRTSPLLAFQVARDGRVVYERTPGLFRQFQSLASRRYADAAKFRRLQRRAIHAFLERQGLE
jgi:predicted nucleotidyltransferase